MSDENGLPDPDVREAAVYARLEALGIPWKTTAHPPVFTVEDSADVYAVLGGCHTKNLFLKDAKGGLWLVCLRAEFHLDLKALSKQLKSPRFSFGSAELLIATLGIAPGAVNPFALMNDAAGKVTCVLDADMLTREPVNFHPMRNDRTTAISAEGLLAFVRATGHEPAIAVLPEKPV
jgi:Ala-tRNA(Pro) deacylase